MSITGTGTAASPYLVHTALELREALIEPDTYVKLANHIDCNNDCRKWETCNVGAIDLNLNEFDVKNIYAADGVTVFNKTTNGLFKIHSGRILNLVMIGSAFNASNYASSGGTSGGYYVERYLNVMYDIALVTEITGCYGNTIFNRGTYFDYCNIKLKSTLSNSEHRLFYENASINAGVQFNDSKIVANTNNQISKGPADPYGIRAIYRHSHVQVQTDIDCENGNYALGSNYSGAVGSIFELKGNDNHVFSRLAASSSGINPFYSDAPINTSHNAELACTAEQIRNSAYLNSIGFANIERA